MDLALLATVVAVAWVGGLSTAELLGAAGWLVALGLLAVLAWAVVHLLAQNGRLLTRLDALEAAVAASGRAPASDLAPAAAAAAPEPGLSVGAPAPAFSLPGLHGETLTLDALRAPGKPVLLIFSDPGCGPCNALLPDIGRWQREHADQVTVALVSRGTPDANRPKSAAHGVSSILLQRDFEVAEAYQASGTPIGVVIRPDGRIGSPLAPGADGIRALVARTIGAPGAAVPDSLDPAPPTAPSPGSNGSGSNGREAQAVASVAAVGDRAPLLRFPSLTGSPMGIGDFRGHQTLVLFWDPGCGFCQQMVDDVRAWEANRPPGAPKLLVISTGTEEANRALGIHAPIVLDQGFEAGRAFGASGTPSAVLVNAQGMIASDVAAGAEDVLALARGEAPSLAAPQANGATVPAPAKVGDPAPELSLPTPSGKTVHLADFRGDKTLVLFWNPDCGFCARMLDDFKALETNPPKEAPKLLVVSTGTPEANRAMGLRSTIVLDQGFSVGSAFGASGTPSAVLVDAQGTIASPVAAGAEAVLALARGQEAPSPAGSAASNGAARPTPKVGDKAPTVKLPDLTGKTIELARLRGTRTLLLFWDPGCGFCSRMLEDLKAWEAKPPKGAPELLVVSTGGVEANQAMGLRSPVVLDQGFGVGKAFGASGTPSAVLVDAEGIVASEVAVGAPAVLALAGGPQSQAARS